MSDPVEVEVTVEQNDDTPTPVEETPAVVVVEDSGSDGGAEVAAAAVPVMVEQAGDLARLEAAVLALAERVDSLTIRTETVALEAEVAVETAGAAMVEAEAAAEQPGPEQDEAPDNSHPWFRNIR